MKKFLFDTHTFLWLRNEPQKVSALALNTYQDANHIVYLSTVSLWEMQIKYQLGKLQFDVPLPEMIEEQCLFNDLRILPIEQKHIFELNNLPFFHKDPFDRLLIAQARVEQIPIITADSLFVQYPVEVVW
ncbi:PilT-like protein [Beggiatoa sp. PS]|nr:PilT-like protein [Beggiatoa sp. PS]